MKLKFKYVKKCFLLASVLASLFATTGCSPQSQETASIVLGKCFRLNHEHVTSTKPSVLNIPNLQAWENCDDLLFKKDITRMTPDVKNETYIIDLIDLEGEHYFLDYCTYNLQLGTTGQRGEGTIQIGEFTCPMQFVDSYFLLINLPVEFSETMTEPITLEFFWWLCQ